MERSEALAAIGAMGTFKDVPGMDEDLVNARAALLESDKQRTEVPLPVGMAAVNASAAANQHLADEVQEAARRVYLHRIQAFEDLAAAECTPWPSFVVSEPPLTQEDAATVPVTNYFFKVRISPDGDPEEYIQICVREDPFGGPTKLVAMRTGAEASGPLAPFEILE